MGCPKRSLRVMVCKIIACSDVQSRQAESTQRDEENGGKSPFSSLDLSRICFSFLGNETVRPASSDPQKQFT